MTPREVWFPEGISEEEWARGVEWCDAVYRERLVPGGLAELDKIDAEMEALSSRRRELIRKMCPEGSRIAGAPYEILMSQLEGISETEARIRIRAHWEETHGPK